jgi:hypothetical protein
MPKWFNKCDARILAAAAAVRSPLVIRFRLKRNAEPLDAGWITSLVELYTGNTDARIVAPRDEPRKKD